MNPASGGSMAPLAGSWQSARPGEIELGKDEVHLWRLDLEDPPSSWSDLESCLDAPERERAAGFGSEPLRRRFVAGRGMLRRILAGYAGVEAPELRIEQGPHGKPRLHPPWANLHFNLAHCGDLALVAVCRGRELGVDLERLRSIPKARRLAARYFSVTEQRWLEAETSAGVDAAFLELWCRKEACLKATGEALSRALGSVAVGLVEAGWDGASVGEFEWGMAGERRCGLQPIAVEGHIAVLAWADPDPPRRLLTFRWIEPA